MAALLKNEFNVSVFTLAILTTVCYQLLSNFANDYGDGIKGTDNDERLGPKRILQSELISIAQLRKAIFVICGVALLLTILLVYSAFGLSRTALTFLGLGFFAIVLLYDTQLVLMHMAIRVLEIYLSFCFLVSVF